MNRKSFLLCLLAAVVCLTAIQSLAADYQTGKIIAVDKLESQSNTMSSGTDAALSPGVTRFNLSIQLNDSVYVCRAKTQSDFDLSWTNGREVQAKTKNNVMYVKKADGKVVKLSIVSTKKAE